MDAVHSIFIHTFGMKRRCRLQLTSADVWTMVESLTSADVGWSISHDRFSRRLEYQLHKQSLSIMWPWTTFCVVHLQLQLAVRGIAGTRPGLNLCHCCCDCGCGWGHRCHGSTGLKVIWMQVKLPLGTGTVTDTMFPPNPINKVGGCTLDCLLCGASSALACRWGNHWHQARSCMAVFATVCPMWMGPIAQMLTIWDINLDHFVNLDD